MGEVAPGPHAKCIFLTDWLLSAADALYGRLTEAGELLDIEGATSVIVKRQRLFEFLLNFYQSYSESLEKLKIQVKYLESQQTSVFQFTQPYHTGPFIPPVAVQPISTDNTNHLQHEPVNSDDTRHLQNGPISNHDTIHLHHDSAQDIDIVTDQAALEAMVQNEDKEEELKQSHLKKGRKPDRKVESERRSPRTRTKIETNNDILDSQEHTSYTSIKQEKLLQKEETNHKVNKSDPLSTQTDTVPPPKPSLPQNESETNNRKNESETNDRKTESETESESSGIPTDSEDTDTDCYDHETVNRNKTPKTVTVIKKELKIQPLIISKTAIKRKIKTLQPVVVKRSKPLSSVVTRGKLARSKLAKNKLGLRAKKSANLGVFAKLKGLALDSPPEDDEVNYAKIPHTIKRAEMSDNMLYFKISGREPVMYMCRVCGHQAPSTDDMTRHIRVHTGDRPYVCDVCNRSYIRRKHLRRHELTHSGVRPHRKKNYSCGYCRRAFDCKAKLLEHTAGHTGEKAHECPLCDFKTRFAKNLRNHREVMHPSEPRERKYMCTECDRTYLSHNTLRAHIKDCHDQQCHICEKCGKNFSSWAGLREHHLSHRGKEFQCPYCEFRTNRPKTLKVHKTKHFERKIQCDICGKILRSIASLKNHLKVMHGPSSSEGKIFSCLFCGACYDGRRKMSAHMRKHKRKLQQQGSKDHEFAMSHFASLERSEIQSKLGKDVNSLLKYANCRSSLPRSLQVKGQDAAPEQKKNTQETSTQDINGANIEEVALATAVTVLSTEDGDLPLSDPVTLVEAMRLHPLEIATLTGVTAPSLGENVMGDNTKTKQSVKTKRKKTNLNSKVKTTRKIQPVEQDKLSVNMTVNAVVNKSKEDGITGENGISTGAVESTAVSGEHVLSVIISDGVNTGEGVFCDAKGTTDVNLNNRTQGVCNNGEKSLSNINVISNEQVLSGVSEENVISDHNAMENLKIEQTNSAKQLNFQTIDLQNFNDNSAKSDFLSLQSNFTNSGLNCAETNNSDGAMNPVSGYDSSSKPDKISTTNTEETSNSYPAKNGTNLNVVQELVLTNSSNQQGEGVLSGVVIGEHNQTQLAQISEARNVGNLRAVTTTTVDNISRTLNLSDLRTVPESVNMMNSLRPTFPPNAIATTASLPDDNHMNIYNRMAAASHYNSLVNRSAAINNYTSGYFHPNSASAYIRGNHPPPNMAGSGAGFQRPDTNAMIINRAMGRNHNSIISHDTGTGPGTGFNPRAFMHLPPPPAPPLGPSEPPPLDALEAVNMIAAGGFPSPSPYMSPWVPSGYPNYHPP